MPSKEKLLDIYRASGDNESIQLVKDDDGYYDVVLHNFGVPGKCGTWIESEDMITALKTFSVREGIFGEFGNPDVSDVKVMEARVIRMRTLEPSMIAVSIKDINLVQLAHRPGRSIVGRVKPVGPFAKNVQAIIDNPDDMLTFSIRSFSNITLFI